MFLDVQERCEIVDQTVSVALASYADPFVQSRIKPSILDGFKTALERTFMPNISNDGMVTIPDKYQDVPEGLPIIPIIPGETLKLGPGFGCFTDSQRDHALAQIARWNPADVTPEESVDVLSTALQTRYDTDPYSVSLNAKAAAMVVSCAGVFNPLPQNLENPPRGDLMVVRARPVMAVGVSTGKQAIEPDLLTHELVHVRQRTEKPLVMYGSQHDVTRTQLKDELEAYHYGAMLRVGLLDKLDDSDPTRDAYQSFDPDGEISIQLHVEAVRRRVKGDDDLYPFAPTPAVKAAMEEYFGLDRMLHQGGVNYDVIKSALTQDL